MAGFWRKCRTTFRWCRFVLWSVIALGLFAFGWLDLIGLPDFLKTRLTATFRERGVQIEFTRMRLRPVHGLVAENIRVGEEGPDRPAFTAGEVQLLLNYPALLHRRFQLDGAVVRDGKFFLPVSATNALVASDVQAQVRFLPGQSWVLDDMHADFNGMRLDLSGQLDHAPEVAHWKIFSGHKPAERGALSQPLRDFADQLARIHFSGQPQLGLTLDGDARDIHSITLRVNASVPEMTSPWFSGRSLQVAAHLTAPTEAPFSADPALDFWTNAFPFRLTWAARAVALDTEKISGTAVKCSGVWLAPVLSVSRTGANLGGGKFEMGADLNVITRAVIFTNNACFDPHVLASFLPDGARPLLAQVLWTRAPALRVAGSLKLPPWTNGFQHWPGDILPDLHVAGDIACTNALVRGATLDVFHTRFSFENSLVSLPSLELVQDHTSLGFSGQYSTVTKNFHVMLHGAADIATARLFLTNSRPLSLVQLTQPLILNADAVGNLGNLAGTTGSGHLSLTNFAVRGQTIESLDTDVVCTNRVLSFLRMQAFRSVGTQTLTADSVTLDFNQHMIFFTNGFSTFDQMVIPRAIGPKTARIIEPYQYLSPPTARVHGQLPLRDFNTGRDLEGTDMTFDVIRGAPWRWERLRATNAVGTIRWLGQYLVLTNIIAGAYGGQADGHAYFDFRPVGYGCDFNFTVNATNIDAHRLALDLSASTTNKLEGNLSGWVDITYGNSKTLHSWNGYGRAQLRDGLLWNIPIFGFASPVLNTFAPGLGNSRATEASGAFVMSNGVARTDSFTVHTPTMRLQYVGTVDLDERVNAHVTAQIMRNTWAIGPIVSAVLWPVSKIFECRVTGRVSEPKVIPILFSPLRSFGQLFSSPSSQPAALSQ